MYIMLAAWSIYVMSWSWWHEMSPHIEAQRIARITLNSIRKGSVDPTAGTYKVGANRYARRNGIAQAKAAPDLSGEHAIDFCLEPDSSNVRSFYLGTDASGLKALFYRDSNGTDHEIKSTIGLKDLAFEFYGGVNNLVKVTATVVRDVKGTRAGGRHIKIVYSDVVHLRNVPN